MKKKSISVIIPVFNEEKTVKKVVTVFLGLPILVDEIICVNDGSTDKSLEILESFGNKIKLINFKKNKGKGYALAKGVKKAIGELVVFFDADFPNLSEKHIRALIEPALKRNYKAVLGVPVKNKLNLSLPTRIFLTGERVYLRKLLIPHLKEMEKTKFGVEVFLNKLVPLKETKIVYLKGLIFPYKYNKRQLPQALKESMVEAVEIAEEFAKREGLLPKDIDIIEGLKQPIDLKEIKTKIKKIKNKRIKELLENYLLKYLDKLFP